MASIDEQFMREAIAEASSDDGEVGCVIVRDGRIVARGRNGPEHRHDPTAHAEVVALRTLGDAEKTIEFPGCTLYCTLQPCGMCMLACVRARIDRVVYGAGGQIDVTGGVLAEECARLYQRPEPPSVTGVLETALYVDDLERSVRFYRDLFDFPVIFEERPRMVALGVAAKHVLLLFTKTLSAKGGSAPGGRIPAHDGEGHLHLAFAIEKGGLEAWASRLASCGIEVESKVTWPRGGTSLYFRDPDGHSVELATPGIWSLY
jgi:catechol 2,3-dioxygenase-like lactoylglutathione lyase family enzyme/pyrimidine deaminase RibD-like protein